MIKVGFCVSYDWMMLKKSVPLVYAHADSICLSIDKHRRTWKGESYPFDEAAFSSWLSSIDTQNKIKVYEDDFSLSTLTAMENDTRQRMQMAAFMGKGGWHVQVDSDEYILNFDDLVKSLTSIHPNPTGGEKPVNVCVCSIPLIKRVAGGFLYVDFADRMPELHPMATNHPQYIRARVSGHFNVVVPVFAIHETWARSEDELWFKMSNWGHSSDELEALAVRKSYYALWKSLDEYNYRYVRNFHPAIAEAWPSLGFFEADTVEALIHQFKLPRFPLNQWQHFLYNSRNVARMKSLWQRIVN